MKRQHVTAPPDSQKNFLVVDSKTDNATIEEAFDRFTTERKDIGILLINQHVHITIIYKRQTANPNSRLLSGYAIESIHTQLPSRRCWKSLARTTRTIPKRTVFYEESEGYLESRYEVFVAGWACCEL